MRRCEGGGRAGVWVRGERRENSQQALTRPRPRPRERGGKIARQQCATLERWLLRRIAQNHKVGGGNSF